MSEFKEYYSPDEVAEQLDLHVRTVRRFIREGKLEAARVGKQYRIPHRALSEFIGAAGSVAKPHTRRRALASTTIDVDAISPEDTQRVTSVLTAVFGSAPDSSGSKRLSCIYYEEQGRLRIVVNADLATTNAMLGLISGLVTPDEAELA